MLVLIGFTSLSYLQKHHKEVLARLAQRAPPAISPPPPPLSLANNPPRIASLEISSVSPKHRRDWRLGSRRYWEVGNEIISSWHRLPFFLSSKFGNLHRQRIGTSWKKVASSVPQRTTVLPILLHLLRLPIFIHFLLYIKYSPKWLLRYMNSPATKFLQRCCFIESS